MKRVVEIYSRLNDIDERLALMLKQPCSCVGDGSGHPAKRGISGGVCCGHRGTDAADKQADAGGVSLQD